MRDHSETRPLVVIVDDDVRVRRALSRYLRLAGFEIAALANAGELLAYEWPARPACLVIDVHLPDMNGLALLSRIREANPRLPVVAITGDTDPDMKRQALWQGAAAFLTKPFAGDRLVAEIRAALGRPGGEAAP